MSDEEMANYPRALDEIAAARVAEAHLELKSFPTSRRRFAEEAVGRHRRCARGEA